MKKLFGKKILLPIFKERKLTGKNSDVILSIMLGTQQNNRRERLEKNITFTWP
jgi:hypothetical protein